MVAHANYFALVLLAAALSASAGCTSRQLRNDTVAQSTTLQDIFTQQVMNNLALFIQNPNALPFFAYPNQGTTALQDSGAVGGPGYASSAALFNTVPFGISGARQTTENWVLVPIYDPAKLALMRCAYQEAIAPCAGTDNHCATCPDCEKLRKGFYGPPEIIPGTSALAPPMPCLNAPGCWLCWGGKCDVPKRCRTPYVGCNNGFYVWVKPEGYDMLTRLTLTILDYAANEPRQFEKRTKTVDMTIAAAEVGVPGGIKISATIPIDVPSQSMLFLENAPAYEEFLKRFGWETAQQLKGIASTAKPGYSTSTIEERRDYWRQADPNSNVFAGEKLKAAVAFIKNHSIIPDLVPTQEVLDAIINSPAVYQRKASASSGLQQLGQRLRAANAPGP